MRILMPLYRLRKCVMLSIATARRVLPFTRFDDAGHNLVIQGPPGTGKSQTIANIIAAAIGDGKTVLSWQKKWRH